MKHAQLIGQKLFPSLQREKIWRWKILSSSEVIRHVHDKVGCNSEIDLVFFRFSRDEFFVPAKLVFDFAIPKYSKKDMCGHEKTTAALHCKGWLQKKPVKHQAIIQYIKRDFFAEKNQV